MHKIAAQWLWPLSVLGVMRLAMPVTPSAAQEQATGPGILQRMLQPGQERIFYAEKLKTPGYRIPSVNDDDPDCLEYEGVKGDRAYEIQIDIAPATNTAAAVTVADDRCQTVSTTEGALEQKIMRAHPDSSSGQTGTPDQRRCSDRVQTADTRRSPSDRQRVTQMLEQLRALPLGKNRQFYRGVLKEHGYTVTKVHADSPQELDVVVQKNGKQIAFIVDFNEETGNSINTEALRVRGKAKAASTQAKTADAVKKEQQEVKQNTPTLHQLVEELRALPIGKERGFYQQALEERGYTIANTQDTQDQREFTVEKAKQTLRLTVQFDKTTETSIKVHASGVHLAS